MALALAQLSRSDFDTIYDHLRQHLPAYQNMHLREVRSPGGQRVLRYLHAMRVKPGNQRAIEGMISGPGILWQYELIPRGARTQITVTRDIASAAERQRIQRQFRTEVMRRIAAEKAGQKGFPKLLSGQFYLRRWKAGMSASHPNCQRAIAQRALHPDFVSQVLAWKLRLLAP